MMIFEETWGDGASGRSAPARFAKEQSVGATDRVQIVCDMIVNVCRIIFEQADGYGPGSSRAKGLGQSRMGNARTPKVRTVMHR